MWYDPYPFQQHCTKRLVEEPCLGVFLDPGMGKTVITLTALHELKYNRWAVNKILVIAPKKVAEATWQKEAGAWDHLRLLRISTVLGTAAQRARALAAPADIYIINRDNVTWLVDYYKHDWPFDTVVLDESSSFKDSSTKRFKALKLIRNRISRLVLLTGTPASNSIMDLWAQLYLLDEGARLGKHITHFRDRFFYQKPWSPHQWQTKEGSFEYIKQAIGDICVSLKAEDYIDLPEMMYNTVPVALNTKTEKAYRQFERQTFLELEGGILTAGTACVLTGKLLQFCNGAVYDVNRRVLPAHDCKLEAFLELLESLQGQAALVFYQFQHDRDRILGALAGVKGLRVRVFKNAQDQEDWNAGKIDVLLAHPMSCAYGLNLQHGGRHVVWFGLTWSLEQYEQANRRLYRQGQRQPVIIHHLMVQGGMDEDVLAALRGKRDMQGALLDALRARMEKVKGGAS